MKTLTVALASCATIACLTAAMAEPLPLPDPVAAVTDLEQNDAFVGLTFPFGGQGIQPPHLTVGLRHSVVTPSGSVTGGELALSIDPFDIGNSRIRVNALTGDTSVQGSLGIGLVVGSRDLFLTGGVHGSHLRLLGDLDLADRNTTLYLETNSLSQPNAPVAAAPVADVPPPPPVCLPPLFLIGNVCVPFPI